MILLVIFLVWWFVFRGQQSAPNGPERPITAKQPVENPQKVQTSDVVDISGWKTYRNDEYGFDMKYPPVESGWAFEEYDYSKNKDFSLPYWPMRGIAIFYDPRHLGNHLSLNGLDIILSPSRYNSPGNIYPIDSKNIYIFDFQGKRAAASSLDKNAIDAFFFRQECMQDIHFELPDVSSILKNKKESAPVMVSFVCRESQTSKELMQVFLTIIRSIRFFR